MITHPPTALDSVVDSPPRLLWVLTLAVVDIKLRLLVVIGDVYSCGCLFAWHSGAGLN